MALSCKTDSCLGVLCAHVGKALQRPCNKWKIPVLITSFRVQGLGEHRQGGHHLAATSPLPDPQCSSSKDGCQASNHPACSPAPCNQGGRH